MSALDGKRVCTYPDESKYPDTNVYYPPPNELCPVHTFPQLRPKQVRPVRCGHRVAGQRPFWVTVKHLEGKSGGFGVSECDKSSRGSGVRGQVLRASFVKEHGEIAQLCGEIVDQRGVLMAE